MGARRYWPIWIAVAPLVLWTAIRTLGLESGSLLTTAMLFTPQAAIAGLLISGMALALRNPLAATFASLATALLMVAVLPRAFGGERTAADGRPTLTVLSANVELGSADPAILIDLVDRLRPDLLSVQELTPSLARRLRAAGLGRRLPHSVLMPGPKGHGAGIYARLPAQPLARQTDFLFRMPRATITLPGGGRARVVAVHPQPPSMSVERWREALESLPAAGGDPPWLLVGDFNATLDHRQFRDLLDRGYLDAAEATGNGLEPTWPGDERGPVGLIAIDHVLLDSRLGVASFGTVDLPGSDHRGVHARLVLPADR